MLEEVASTMGQWWRASRYVLQEGHIRPTSDARLESYDPWQALGVADQPPPYQLLLDLLDRLDYDWTPAGFVIQPESEPAIIDWCAEHGLLGILLHEARQINLAPRWQIMRRIDGLEDRDMPPVRVQRRHVQTTFGWELRDVQHAAFTPQSSQGTPGALVAAHDRPRDWPPPGVVLERATDLSPWRDEPFTGTWARYFPDVPEGEREDYPYPLPLSDAFWRLYAEPIQDFIGAALTLRNALLDLSRDDDQRARAAGANRLTVVAAPVRQALLPLPDGSFQQRWLAPTLLASFAAMASQDIARPGHRVRRCAVCGRLVVTKAYQLRYCSQTCRHTAQKRNYRRRVRESGSPHGRSGGEA